jgi:hypothetical protein
MFSEEDMENAIATNPTRFLKRKGLKLLYRQHTIGKFRFDLLFENQVGRKIIVEIQKGTLDRNHSFKIVDYSLKYRDMHPSEDVEVIIVANVILPDRRQFFDELKFSYVEIPDEDIILWKSENQSIERNRGDSKITLMKSPIRKSIRSPNPLRQQLLDEVKKQIPAFRGRPVDITKNNISASAGKNGSEWVIVTRNNDYRIELAFRDKNTAKTYFKKIEKYKANIENEFGENLYWDFKPDRKDQYIKTIDKRFAEISGNLEEVINYLVEHMRKFMSVVGNYWDKVKRK